MRMEERKLEELWEIARVKEEIKKRRKRFKENVISTNSRKKENEDSDRYYLGKENERRKEYGLTEDKKDKLFKVFKLLFTNIAFLASCPPPPSLFLHVITFLSVSFIPFLTSCFLSFHFSHYKIFLHLSSLSFTLFAFPIFCLLFPYSLIVSVFFLTFPLLPLLLHTFIPLYYLHFLFLHRTRPQG